MNPNPPQRERDPTSLLSKIPAKNLTKTHLREKERERERGRESQIPPQKNQGERDSQKPTSSETAERGRGMTISMVFRANSINHTPSFPNPTKTHFLSPQSLLHFYKKTPLKNHIGEFSCSSPGPVVVGLAADSGCGKTTFMKRLTSVFGGAPKADHNHQNPDSNTLITDTTTVICLDDYHLLDRKERKEKGVTALHPRANNFDLMFEQIEALKHGFPIEKPIYNHATGLLDPPELIHPPKILVLEGLHPL